MTLNELTADLYRFPAEAALLFETDSGPIGAGYHVTELKLSEVTSIDCGGTLSSWRETALQLLDGSGDRPMQVGKFLAIADKSSKAIPGLGSCPLRVEFSHGNTGKQIFQPGSATLLNGIVSVPLLGDPATCKPAQPMRPIRAVDSANCARTPTQAGCCG